MSLIAGCALWIVCFVLAACGAVCVNSNTLAAAATPRIPVFMLSPVVGNVAGSATHRCESAFPTRTWDKADIRLRRERPIGLVADPRCSRPKDVGNLIFLLTIVRSQGMRID